MSELGHMGEAVEGSVYKMLLSFKMHFPKVQGVMISDMPFCNPNTPASQQHQCRVYLEPSIERLQAYLDRAPQGTKTPKVPPCHHKPAHFLIAPVL